MNKICRICVHREKSYSVRPCNTCFDGVVGRDEGSIVSNFEEEKKRCEDCEDCRFNKKNKTIFPCLNCCDKSNWKPKVEPKPDVKNCLNCNYELLEAHEGHCLNCNEHVKWTPKIEPKPEVELKPEVEVKRYCDTCKYRLSKMGNNPCNECKSGYSKWKPIKPKPKPEVKKWCSNCEFKSLTLHDSPCAECGGISTKYSKWKPIKPKPEVKKSCVNCEYGSLLNDEHPCNECSGGCSNYTKWKPKPEKVEPKILTLQEIQEQFCYKRQEVKELGSQLQMKYIKITSDIFDLFKLNNDILQTNAWFTPDKVENNYKRILDNGESHLIIAANGFCFEIVSKRYGSLLYSCLTTGEKKLVPLKHLDRALEIIKQMKVSIDKIFAIEYHKQSKKMDEEKQYYLSMLGGSDE